MERAARLHYIDWLRVGAFGLLILYHASAAFFPGMPWLIHAAETSPALEAAMNHPRAWRLALLFFVSGMGVHFASRRLPLGTFLAERFRRLSLPLAAGMTVFVVPQVWCERVMEEGYGGSLATFWLTRYFTEGKYPQGNITWAHLWFVAYLIAMIVLLVPVLKRLDGPGGSRVTAWVERMARTQWLYAAFLVPLALNLLLSPVFPRETNALYNDGAWFAVWACWFAFGYVFARSHGALVGHVVSQRWTSARLAAIVTGYLVLLSWGPKGPLWIGGYAEMGAIFKLLVFALAWTMILALVGFAARHLDRTNRLVAYLNDGVFAFYLIHQTVVVAALFAVLPLGLGLWTTYGLVVASTVAGSLLFYEIGRRLPSPAAAAFGIRKRPRSEPAPPAAEPAERPAETVKIAA